MEQNDAEKDGFRKEGAEQRWAKQCGKTVAFLRHRLPDLPHRDSSDWDVAAQDLEVARKILEKKFGSPYLTIRRPYVSQNYFRWGQVDFLPVFEWNGFEYLPQDRFWRGVSIGDDKLPRPRIAHDAMIAWFTGILGDGYYKGRYDTLLKRALSEDRGEFEECLRWAFGQSEANRLIEFLQNDRSEDVALRYQRLRRSLKWRRFRKTPWKTLSRVCSHWGTELRHHLCPQHPWVAILGPDGSGKSSVIAGIQHHLKKSRLKTLVMHWRPKASGAEPDDPVPVVDPHMQIPRGFFLSTVALILLWIRWMVGRLGKVWHSRAKQKMLLSDRYYLDLLVDPIRYRYGGSLKLADWCFRLFPKPDLTLILGGNAAVIHARKNEVPLAEAERQIEAYELLGKKLQTRGQQVVLIDAAQSLEKVNRDVVTSLEATVFIQK